MPIYDYVCASCRQVTEVIHGIEAPGPRFCPACGAEGTMRKTFAAPTVHFKGSGWAKKDRSSSGGARARAGGGASSGDASSGDASSGDASSGDASSGDGPGKTGETGETAATSRPASEGGDAAKASKRAGGTARSDEG